MKRQLQILVLFAAVMATTVGGLATSSYAQVSKAFQISGSGIIPEGIPLPGEAPRPHSVIGNATHLGLHVGAGTVQTTSADFSQFPECITGVFGSGSPFTFVGADGDQLVCDYGRDEDGNAVGTVKLNILEINPDGSLLVDSHWLADFVVRGTESTGKFAGISGSWIMVARSEPFILGSPDPVNYSWSGRGRLVFQK